MFSNIRSILLASQIGLILGASPFEEQKSDWRELCRQNIGGNYLLLLDQLRHQEALIVRSKMQMNKIKEHLQYGMQALRESELLYEQEPFSAKIAERRDSAKARVDALIEQQSQLEVILETAKADASKYKRSFESFTAKVSKVFRVRHDQSLAKNGYPVAIEYLDQCPAYREVCPLPAKVKIRLANIFDSELPTACERYIAIH